MKKIFNLLILVFICQSVYSQTSSSENDSIDICFEIVTPKECSLNASQRDEIKSKLNLLLARTGTAGAVAQTPFVIVPDIKLTDKNNSGGTLQQMTFIEGELTLIVRNRYDGISYNELTLPLKGLAETKKELDPIMRLINNINIKDRRLTRFIRLSCDRIVSYYSGRTVEVPQ